MVTAMEQERPPQHFPDELRVGVLAGEEEQELRLAAHFMVCDVCREPAFILLSDVGWNAPRRPAAQEANCLKARNALFRYFEQGRQIDQEVIAHLNVCEECQRHFLDPTKAAVTLEDDAVAGLD